MLNPNEIALSNQSDRIRTVSELTADIKGVLEDKFCETWVCGEISNCRKQASGHIYLTLKDEGAQVSAVVFKGYASRFAKLIADGNKVSVFGNLSIYAPRGQYQIIVRFVAPSGVGQLQLEFNRLKEKLSAEGLFDAEKKKPIPFFPRRVGVITSPTGAAIRDFLSILKRRGWRGEVLILPSKVQGIGAKEEIVEQVNLAKTLSLDLLVLSRGGGSLEDLWPFNEENVARAVAACPIPTLSAVGHEIDFTLCDFAADFRAETPSAAAEKLTSDFIDVQDRVEGAQQFLQKEVVHVLSLLLAKLEGFRGSINPKSLKRYLEGLYLRQDDLVRSFALGLVNQFEKNRSLFKDIKNQFLHLNVEGQVERFSNHCQQLAHRLKNMHFSSVLKRGYGVVRDLSGAILPRCEFFGKNLVIEMFDGSVQVKNESKE